MQTLQMIAMYGAFVVAGLVVMLNGIAPLTKTDLDNKALSVLRWVQDTVFKLILPAHAAKLAPAKDPQ